MFLTIAAIIGMRIVHVAELLVTSVSRADSEHTIINMSQPGRLPNTDNWSPIHWDKPDTWRCLWVWIFMELNFRSCKHLWKLQSSLYYPMLNRFPELLHQQQRGPIKKTGKKFNNFSCISSFLNLSWYFREGIYHGHCDMSYILIETVSPQCVLKVTQQWFFNTV